MEIPKEFFTGKKPLGPSNIPPLNEHYYKSRNSLLMFSAILLAWELIGINLESYETSGTKITIEDGEAIPYVLFILIVYFIYRVTIEWLQSDELRRTLKQSKVDFITTMIIPVLSMAIYSIQRWLDFSIFESPKVKSWIVIIIGILTIVFLTYNIFKARKYINEEILKDKKLTDAHDKPMADLTKNMKK
jgi:hypothetical protein